MCEIEIIRPREHVSLSPEDSGFAHGYGVFETMRISGSCVQFWGAHWERLRRAAKALGISLACAPEAVVDAIRELVSGLNGEVHIVKLSAIKEARRARLLVYAREPFPSPGSVGLLVDPAFRLNERSPLKGLKTHNYIENMYLTNVARSKGCYDLVRQNTRGMIAEGAVSNLFWARDGQLFTPGEETGILPGVVRAALVAGLDVAEGSFSLDELLSADEVFLTNSSVGVLFAEWLLHDESQIHLGAKGSGLALALARAVERGIESDHITI